MQSLKTSFALCLLLCCNFFANGQNISSASLTWTVDHLTDQKTLADFDYSCSFKTYGNQDVTWLQHNGTVTSTLSAQSLNGTWADVSTSGQVTFSISTNGKNGTLKFERNDSGVFITLDLTPSDSTGIKHQYRVINIQSN